MSLDAAYPSRQELIALNKRLTKATAARDAAQESYDRLERPTRLLTDVSREHAAEKALHDAAIVVWYESGCPGVRPDVPSRMIELERQLGDLRRDLGASAIALEIAASGLQAANEHLAEQQVRQRGALYGAAVEAARDRLQRYATPAMIEAMLQLSVIEALTAELRRQPHPEALNASRKIDEMIKVARASIGVRCDLDPARRFFAELERNPEAELVDIGAPTIEHLEAPVMRPVEDGSQHINRGPVEEAQPVPRDWWPNPALDPDEAWRHFHPNPIWSSLTSETLEPGEMVNTANSPLASG